MLILCFYSYKTGDLDENCSIWPNQYENAVFSKALIEKRFGANNNVRILLITSGFHFRRSAACFKKAGIQFDSYPTDFRSLSFVVSPGGALVPSSSALEKWDMLFHEWFGYLAYAIAGYV